jgi:hypothetical protein
MILSKWIKKTGPVGLQGHPLPWPKTGFLKKNDCPKEGAGEGT